MATNWNAVLANINNASDILAILRKVLGLLDGKVDSTIIDETLARLEKLAEDGQLTIVEALNTINLLEERIDERTAAFNEAIEIAVAAGAGANGWTDELILTESGVTQRALNRAAGFKSMVDLLTSKPISTLVKLQSYHQGGWLGGSDFIAIQSNILIENGVTVFRSKVVGYEDWFWVRANIDHITPEMAGAIGDKSYNCREALQKCLDIGGEIKLKPNSKYLAHATDLVTHRNTFVLLAENPVSITCGGKAQICFLHDLVTGSPCSLLARGKAANLDSFVADGIDFVGHPEVGHSNKIARSWGMQLWGVDNIRITRCKFSTMQGHNLGIYKRKFDNNGDWIQSTDLNAANTEAAVLRLHTMCSKNGTIENIKLEHLGTSGFAIFGGHNIMVNGVEADTTGALYPYVVWTDDASSETALKDYAVNSEVHLQRISGGGVLLDGCVSGSLTKSKISHLSIRSYDFDQQKNNFDSTAHVYNPDDHINEPFLWMKYFERGIKASDNIINTVSIRSIYGDIYDNTLISQASSHEFINVDINGIRWGTGVDYFDADTTNALGVKSNIKDNTFVLKHNNCICVDYGTASASSYVNVINSVIERTDPSFTYTHMRNANQTYRRDSYYLTSNSSGNLLSQYINHHIDIKQSLMTQGVGTNHYKTFVNIYANVVAQPIVSLTNTVNSVWLFIVLRDSSGRRFRKKVELKSDNTIVVTDDDAQTIYNASFAVVVNAGVISLMFTPSTHDVSMDIDGLGRLGNCVFMNPAPRATSTG